MQLLGPGYNTTFVDRLERSIYGLRQCNRDRVFEVEELFDYIFWDTQELPLNMMSPTKKVPGKVLKMWHRYIEDNDEDKTTINNLCDALPCKFCRVIQADPTDDPLAFLSSNFGSESPLKATDLDIGSTHHVHVNKKFTSMQTMNMFTNLHTDVFRQCANRIENQHTVFDPTPMKKRVNVEETI